MCDARINMLDQCVEQDGSARLSILQLKKGIDECRYLWIDMRCIPYSSPPSIVYRRG